MGTRCVMIATVAFEGDCALMRFRVTVHPSAHGLSTIGYVSTCFPWRESQRKLRRCRLDRMLQIALVLSQFLSAILLDLDQGFVIGPEFVETYAGGPEQLSTSCRQTPWHKEPQPFARFAELPRAAISVSASSTGRGAEWHRCTLKAFLI